MQDSHANPTRTRLAASHSQGYTFSSLGPIRRLVRYEVCKSVSLFKKGYHGNHLTRCQFKKISERWLGYNLQYRTINSCFSMKVVKNEVLIV